MQKQEIMTYGWSEKGAESIERALARELPNYPFLLNNYTLVIGPKFREMLIEDIKAGPNGPRNTYLAVQAIIKNLIRASLEPISEKERMRFKK